MRLVVLLILTLHGAAYGAAPDGRIAGRVLQSPAAAGPQRIGDAVSSAPLAGVTVSLRQGQTLAASASTGADGSFALHAGPGKYTLQVDISGVYPRCPEQSVTLRKGALIRPVLRCDSGMR